jgi:hypothetical protein
VPRRNVLDRGDDLEQPIRPVDDGTAEAVVAASAISARSAGWTMPNSSSIEGVVVAGSKPYHE